MILSEQRLAKLAGLSESAPSQDDEQVRIEEGLRKAIRHEIEKVLAEVLASHDSMLIQCAQAKKSVSTAMGFTGMGFTNSLRNSSPATSQHSTLPSPNASRTLGFKGPGF